MPEPKQGPASAAPAVEPLSAILAEMRKRVSGEDGIKYMMTADEALSLADRIEAAAERESEINQKILAAADEANAILKDDRDRAIQFANAAPHPGSVSWKEMHEVYAKARAILSAVPKEGNAAAMREALEMCVADYDSDDKAMVAWRAAKDALAAPARNCDVGTAAEQKARHDRFCSRHYKAECVDSQCFGCPAHEEKTETDCEFVWGQLPFDQAEGGAE